MGTNRLNIKICESVEEAPDYNLLGVGYKSLDFTNAVVVCRGTVEGNPTVDLEFTDKDGNKYVALVTGGIIENLGAVTQGARIRSTTN